MASDPRGLTHIDPDGNPRMVDVSEKPDTNRVAVAEGRVTLSAEALAAITTGRVRKGDVLLVAQLAGIQAAGRAADLIPLCHPLPIDGVEVAVEPRDGAIHVQATVRTRWRTGVEMEALAAVTGACLTVYDMCKAIDRGMRIEGVRLLEKRGGRSGAWRADDAPGRPR
jgi:cyclic pyranopterin phosphate synthase